MNDEPGTVGVEPEQTIIPGAAGEPLVTDDVPPVRDDIPPAAEIPRVAAEIPRVAAEIPRVADEIPHVALEEPRVPEHADGELRVPDGYTVIEGAPGGDGRSVGIVVARFNGEITGRLLESALAALEEHGVARDAVTVMPVPGAFELPLAAMALAKTRRYACIVALGAVIRGETPHFDYVAGEAASGLQLAALETGVPVSFGVLTCDTVAQAEARTDKGAEAVRTGLEMADVFTQVRAAVNVAKA